MTQLYIGNLSAEADEKTVRAVFGKYGVIRDTVMKNGYAFLAFDSPMSADVAVKEMNGKRSTYSVETLDIRTPLSVQFRSSTGKC